MENEKKYTPTCYTIARVVGDAQVKTGANGKEYLVVKIELLGGYKASAFCRVAPEVQSYVMVRVRHRENGFAYDIYNPSLDSVSFMADACTQWQYAVVK